MESKPRKKPYRKPTLEKREQIKEITEGAAPAVS